MEIENGITLRNAINLIPLYDVAVPEFWRYVNSFYGNSLSDLQDSTSYLEDTIKALFWFNSTNGRDLSNPDGYSLTYYMNEYDKLIWMKIKYKEEVLWQLR